MIRIRSICCLALWLASGLSAGAFVLGERVTAATFDPASSYVLVNRSTGAVIDIEGRSVLNLANIHPGQIDGSTYQLWRFVPQTNGSFYIFNRANDKVIMVDGGSKLVGANILQARNANSQRNAWDLQPAGDHFFRLVNRNSSLPLGISDPTDPLGGNIVQAASNPADHGQQWAIYRAEPPAVAMPDFSLRGFAAHGGVTGGAGGQTVIVNTATSLAHHIAREDPLIIFVLGTIELPVNPDTPHSSPSGRMYTVASNKTIIGLNGARIRFGGFNLSRVDNVIIRNLTFSEAADDCINIEHGTTRVWIDHNDFSNSFDGLVDIKRESDFITVSWNRFHDHDKTCLLGHDDAHTDDRGHLRVTYHHNWFLNNEQRLPRVRYARTHLFNNLYQNIGGYTAGIGVEAQIISDNNVIDGANSGYTLYDKASQPGFLLERGSIYSRLNNDLPATSAAGIDWSPSDYYAAVPDHVLSVPQLVMAGSGVGVIDPFELGGSFDPPVIVSGPASRTAHVGTSTTFTVVASGTPPLLYQWYHDGALLEGQISPSLALHELLLSAAGEYMVVVTNLIGETTNATATLTVDPTPIGPSFVNPPASQSVPVGGTAVFHAGANGTAPLSYTWTRDGLIMPDENGPSLILTNLTSADASVFTVTASNAGGSITSPPFFLAVPPAAAAPVLNDAFADGNRSGQSLPNSAAWFTSSGSSNFTASVGAATQLVSSSRTVLAYFTGSSASPLTLGENQRLTFEFTCSFTGFDAAATAGSPTLRVGLLRSVANPEATSGTGFTASGTPNTQARVTGDFGSNNPSNNPFNLYEGYVALAAVQATPAQVPVSFAIRNKVHAALIGNADAFTTLSNASPPSAAEPMQAGTSYRGRLSLTRAAGKVESRFELERVSDGAVMMSRSASDPAESFTAFDTVAFHLSKAAASANYSFIINRAAVTLTTLPAPGFAGWIGHLGLPASLSGALADPDGDGVPNLLEFALALNPLSAEPSAFSVFELPEGNERYLTFSYTRRRNLGNVSLYAQVAPTLEFTSELGSIELLVVPHDDVSDEVVARSAVPISASPSQFMRLAASQE
jgi:pectate lyase